MRSIYTNTILSIFLFFILLSFLLLNNASSEVELDEKKKIYLYLYDVITVVFICVLIFLIMFKGYFYGLIDAIFIWAFFVIATPVPESGLLISLPLKRFFNIKMTYVQVLVSILAIFLTFYLYKCHGSVVKATYIGRLFDEIVKSKYYIIMVLSIASSILGSELIDNYIDMVVGGSNEIENLQVKLIVMVLLLMTFMLLLNPLVKIK
jgi:hypothetical protein